MLFRKKRRWIKNMTTDFSKQVIKSSLDHTYIFSTGQAGFIIKSKSGQLLAIDLYLSNCVERTEGDEYVRMLPQILQPNELIFDVYIATHPHFDHFDIDSIPQIMDNKKTVMYCSELCNDFVSSLKIDESLIEYVKPGDTRQIGDFYIEFVNCDHGMSAPDAVGVIVNVDGKRIYETGDTCLRVDRLDEILKNGSVDVLIAPINGAFGNMNEEECACFANIIKPKVTIPCHYGMFPAHGGNPGRFYHIMKEKFKNNKFIILTQGDCYEVR